jgi:serine phosphatase RsbU (regulator of sigma subunit)
MEHYGIERLEAVLAEMQGKSAREILSELEKDIQAFYQGKPMVDDYTLLVVRKGRG